jgi:hypothetical protein
LNVTGYTWYGNNRSFVHVRARKGSGGTGILVKDSLFQTFYIDLIDKSFEGIIGIRLIDKISQCSVVIFSCYLPPENSPYATNCNDFFTHLSSKVYLYCNCDVLLICGDLNARVGKLKDTIICDSNISERKIIDSCHSNHGELLIDFLLENKLCIINGRITPENDNFTSISVRGKAVVDFIITRHDCLKSVRKAQVLVTTDLIDRLNLFEMLGNDCKPPDHSVVNIMLDFPQFTNIENIDYDTSQNYVNISPVAVHEHKHYKFIDIPDSFQNNVNWRESIASLIDRFIYLSNSQHEMDTLYNEFCSVLVSEMDSFLKYSCASKKSTGGTGSRQYKPFWTNDLKRYWKDMKDAEKKFLYAKRNDSFYHDFTRKRKLFMKELRQTERKYWQSQMNELI